MASMGLNIDEQKAVEKFRKEVVDPSQTKLVILDFWAEWCGPCKAVAPMLEKVAAEYADKGVVLAKINVDEEQFIAGQFQVKSIPTIYAMFQGQPVADLTSARTESQLKQALDQLISQLPLNGGGDEAGGQQGPSAEEIAQFVQMGEQSLSDGDAQRAAGIFSQVIEFDTKNAAAHAGLIRALVQIDQIEEARQILDAVEADIEMGKDPAIAAAKSAVELASTQVDDSELEVLKSAAEEESADMAAKLAYAEAAFAAGQREEASDALLKMISEDREWNEGAAKAKLLQIFEATGLEDEWVVATRRRLSKLLFG